MNWGAVAGGVMGVGITAINKFVVIAILAVVAAFITLALPNSGPPRDGLTCPAIVAPVCGERNGVRKTYGNSCVAAIAGARVVTEGTCQ